MIEKTTRATGLETDAPLNSCHAATEEADGSE
jgi:hypothetical protein